MAQTMPIPPDAEARLNMLETTIAETNGGDASTAQNEQAESNSKK